MRRSLLAVLFALIAGPVSAQVVGIPPGSLMPPVIVFPASAVNGAGVMTIPLQLPDGSAGAPSLTFVDATDTGLFQSNETHVVDIATSGTHTFRFQGTAFNLGSGGSVNWTSTTPRGTVDLSLVRDAANILAQRNGTNAQTFRVYNTFTDASNYERGFARWSANLFEVGTEAAGSGTGRNVRINAAGGTITLLNNATSCALSSLLSCAAPVTGTLLTSSTNVVTAAASQAAGGTVNQTGTVTRQQYQVTVAPATGDCSTAFNAAALTADCTIATLPAGQKLVGVYADVTAGFTCSGTCSGTKVMQAGTAAGGTQVLAASLNVAATGTFGLLDADLGSGMTRAAAIQGGLIGSWSTTTPISVRFTSGTGNWGSGSATFVNAGVVKFTLLTEQVK